MTAAHLHPPTDAELREHYARTGLARMGLPYERAINSQAIRITLTGAIKAARRIAALQARAAAIPHQTPETH